MYEIEEEPIETVHLYVVPEYAEDAGPFSVLRIINAIACTLVLILLCAVPASADIGPKTILVPLEFLPLQTFTATVEIIPTGERIVPATASHGALMIYNGSVIVQEIPAGFVVSSQSGVQIATDELVTVAAGNPPDYGMATVAAHAVQPGASGNIAPGSVDATDGSSLYLRNLSAFSGGNDAYGVPVATDEDRAIALSWAREEVQVEQQGYPAILDGPCEEAIIPDGERVSVSWDCQFVRYEIPKGVQILSVERRGNEVVLQVK